MKITELKSAVQGRLRFKGEDIVNLTEILDDLEALDAGVGATPEPIDDPTPPTTTPSFPPRLPGRS